MNTVRRPGARRLSTLTAVAVFVFSAVLVHSQPQGPSSGAGDHWVGTWATAVVGRPQGAQAGPPIAFGPPPGPAAPVAQTAATQVPAGNQTPPAAVAPTVGVPPGGRGAGRGGAPPLNFNNQTLRQIVHTTIGGNRVRVVLSNAFGTSPLEIGKAQIAPRDKGEKLAMASAHALTFSGRGSATIPPGAVLFTDAVTLSVEAQTDLAIDLYLPGDSAASNSPVTTHSGALQTSFVSTTGDYVGQADFPVMTTTQSWFFLARVEVTAAESVGAVVTFGDSITDGSRSTPDTNNRWPDHFARRLATQNIRMAVLNEGIAGNRVLADGAGVSALARFDRDVLAQTGATHVVVLESINDIGLARTNPTPTVADLIAAHQQLIERAHARGLKIYGATLTPFEGAAYWTMEGEAKRQAVNEWIRTSKAYDGVIDFDAAVRDPAAPTKLLPQYNPGDNLHMNDAGYEAMANGVDLSLFKVPERSTRK
jgi:lysophospholipase L1-like esterase